MCTDALKPNIFPISTPHAGSKTIKGIAAVMSGGGPSAHHENYIGDWGNLLADRQLAQSHACLMGSHMPACLYHLNSNSWLERPLVSNRLHATVWP